MQLTKFTDLLDGKNPSAPPFRIPAAVLDDNFSRLRPLQQDGDSKQYAVTETPQGWSLTIFPPYPDSGLHVLGIKDGKIQWIPTTGCAS